LRPGVDWRAMPTRPKPRRPDPRRLARLLIAVLGAALLWIPAVAWAAREAADQPEETKLVTAPVTLDGEMLFRVRGVPALPAEERAHLISERIAAVAADPAIAPESLRVVETEGRSDILAGERHVASIVDADAAVEDVERPSLALANLHRIQESIAAYRRDRGREMLKWAAVRSGAALAGLLIGAFVV